MNNPMSGTEDYNQGNPGITPIPFQEMCNLDIPANEAYKKLLSLISEAKPLHEVDRAYAAFVLLRNNGNKLQASKRLQVDRRTLQRWEKGLNGGGGRAGRPLVKEKEEASLSPE
jgi:DNA-binding NtrC family response regulator